MDTQGAPIYTTLTTDTKEIRVLNLLASDGSGIPRVQMHIRTLESVSQNFHAISYTWGDSTPKHTIILNDHRVLIARHAFLLLSQYHATDLYGDPVPFLWIDAMCIDQSNLAERNQQVQLMGEIYRSASDTVIWLDEFSMDSEKWELSTMLSCQYKWQEEVFWTFQRVVLMWREMWTRAGYGNTAVVPVIEQICQMAKHAYWRRLWIIQEVLLARRVRVLVRGRVVDLKKCGYLTDRAVGFYERYGSGRSEEMSDALLPIDDLLYQQAVAPTRSLYRLLTFANDRGCSDVRDRLYGLLGIAIDGDRLAVDYNMSCMELFFECLLLIHIKGTAWYHETNTLAKTLELSIERICEYLVGLQEDMQVRCHVKDHSISFPAKYQSKVRFDDSGILSHAQGRVYCSEEITSRRHRLTVLERSTGELEFLGFADINTGLLEECEPYESPGPAPRRGELPRRDFIEFRCSTWEVIWLLALSKSFNEDIVALRRIASERCRALESKEGLRLALERATDTSFNGIMESSQARMDPLLSWER